MENKRKKAVRVLLLAGMAVCLIPVCQAYVKTAQHREQQEEFEDFYGNIKELSLYDTGVEAKYGDTFLTLSTCAYHVPDGWLVVVARRTA